MKKIMAVLATLMLVLPFTGVKAATTIDGSVREYKVGDVVNFYKNQQEKNEANPNSGFTTIILSTEKVDGKYIKTLGSAPFDTQDVYYDPNLDSEPTATVRPNHVSYIEQYISPYTLDSAKDIHSNIRYITLEELQTAFGATYDQATDTYVIDAAKWGKVFIDNGFTANINASKGFYTSTYDVANDYVWVVTYKYDSTDLSTANITDIIVKKVSMDNNEYGYLPVIYFDETYDCHYVESQEDYACYACGEDYTWTEVGKQAETCTLVESIKTKSKCAKNVKTGIEEYALEFVGIIAVCAVALVIVKRKELFRSI